MLEDFGFGGDEFLVGDCMGDWDLGCREADDYRQEQLELAGDEWEERQEVLRELAEEQEDCPLDGDAESALASCGWGTDEDYGSYEADPYEY